MREPTAIPSARIGFSAWDGVVTLWPHVTIMNLLFAYEEKEPTHSTGKRKKKK